MKKGLVFVIFIFMMIALACDDTDPPDPLDPPDLPLPIVATGGGWFETVEGKGLPAGQAGTEFIIKLPV